MAEEKELQDLIEFLKSPKHQVCDYYPRTAVNTCGLHMCRIQLPMC